MKSLKYKILFVILFMTIGIAAVTTNLITNGSTNIASNPDDFNVYFSSVNADLNSQEYDMNILSDKKISFAVELKAIGDEFIFDFDVTNSSINYDAQVSLDCTESDDYLFIVYDLQSIIRARSTVGGAVSIELRKSYTGSDTLVKEITCTINATAIERTSQGSGSVNAPVNPFYIGREVAIGDDDFYIIEDNTDNITLLTKYVLDETYRQNSTDFYSGDVVNMNSPGGWSTDIKDFDINVYSTEAVVYVNNYVDYLKGVTGEDNISGNLITLMQLKNLGCSIDETYKSLYMYCDESPHKDIIFNNQRWATRSADGTYSKEYFVVAVEDFICSTDLYADGYIRPIITISKDVAYSLIDEYNVGQEIALGVEKFNVIRDNGTTVSMLAQQNISDTTFKQTTNQMYTIFSSGIGWEYTPGPKDIDFWNWSSSAASLTDEYINYFKDELDLDVSADLITVRELGNLGCSISASYTWGDYDCNNSQYSDWLVNGQSWWTRSASSAHSDRIWVLGGDGYFWINYNDDGITDPAGVRPVITINKEDLAQV